MLNLSYISGASPVARLYLAGVLVGSDISTTEIGTTGEYFAPVPVATAAGEYVVIFFNGAAKVASGLLFWDGTKEATPLNIEVTVDFTEVLEAVGTPLQASDYTAPANADIAAIKAKTDTLVNTDTSTLATSAQVTDLATATGTPLQASDYTAPATAEAIATQVELQIINEDDGRAVLQAIAEKIMAEEVSSTVIAQSVRAQLAPELARIDVAISTRSTLTPSQIPEGLTAAQVWGHSTRTLTAGAGITAAEVWAHSTRTLTEDVGLTSTQATQLANIHTWTDALPTLTDIEGSTALAMQATSLAIKAKTDALQNPDLSGLATSAQLAPLATTAQVGTLATATQVQALAEAAGTPLQAGDYTAPPAPATVAAAVRTELATELARIDAPTTSRLADAAYTAPDNATALQTKQIAIEIQTRVDAALGAPN